MPSLSHKPNRLIHEQSPYLLQHAYNPVDWMPWSEESFARARRENKPIFLSIGYSTCHWCHVMERESFEDDEVARALNEQFVSIKVDREERPDIDQVYMTFCQTLTGAGGWPLTIILTPDKKPFFAGTYFPKESRMGHPGLLDIISNIARLWQNENSRVLLSAEEITGAIRQAAAQPQPHRQLNESTLETAYLQLVRAYDPIHGGFSYRPKFPTPHNLLFLLRYHHHYHNKQALEMVEKTLHHMRCGGIFDHIGYGFHRYSTDEKWLVPHFEKMLYDQALLAMAYTEAYQVTRHEEYRQTAHEILHYVLRDMRSPEGPFYSAEDADSEGQEGKFYVWTTEEIHSVLGTEEAELFIRVYRIKDGGNFADEVTAQANADNIPYLEISLEEIASQRSMSADSLRDRLAKDRRKLFAVREQRVHPLKDDKILTDWNGLMIAALAKAAAVLDEPHYGEAASQAAEFIWHHLKDSSGRLYKRYRNGMAALQGMLDDYAFLAWGFIELYEYNFQPRFLAWAMELTQTMQEHFRDQESGALFLTPDDGEALPMRLKDASDGAIPSGNSVAAWNLLRLSRLTGNPEFQEIAQGIFDCFAGDAAPRAAAYSFMMCALDYATAPSTQIVIASPAYTDAVRQLAGIVSRHYLPNADVLVKLTDDPAGIESLSPSSFLREMKSIDDRATAYLCHNFACQQPVTAPDELEALIQHLAGIDL